MSTTHEPNELSEIAGSLAFAVQVAAKILAKNSPGKSDVNTWARYLFLAGSQFYKHRLEPEKQQQFLLDLAEEYKLQPNLEISDDILKDLLLQVLHGEGISV